MYGLLEDGQIYVEVTTSRSSCGSRSRAQRPCRDSPALEDGGTRPRRDVAVAGTHARPRSRCSAIVFGQLFTARTHAAAGPFAPCRQWACRSTALSLTPPAQPLLSTIKHLFAHVQIKKGVRARSADWRHFGRVNTIFCDGRCRVVSEWRRIGADLPEQRRESLAPLLKGPSEVFVFRWRLIRDEVDSHVAAAARRIGLWKRSRKEDDVRAIPPKELGARRLRRVHFSNSSRNGPDDFAILNSCSARKAALCGSAPPFPERGSHRMESVST
jgi:hypothetical protein